MPTHDVVAVAGDWHGAKSWSVNRIRNASKRGVKVILHVGDFGIWPGDSGYKFLRAVEYACQLRGVILLVTPGNHDDWHQIDNHPARDRGDGWGPVKWFTPHVGVLPRGSRFTVESTSGVSRSFVSLGGAPSVDREGRVEGADWWPAELMSPTDVENTIVGGHADVMITHDAPDGGTDEVADLFRYNPQGWPGDALVYAAGGRHLVTRAWHGVAPKRLFHGHMHLFGAKAVPVGDPDNPSECLVVSLDRDGEPNNMAYLDVATLDVEVV